MPLNVKLIGFLKMLPFKICEYPTILENILSIISEMFWVQIYSSDQIFSFFCPNIWFLSEKFKALSVLSLFNPVDRKGRIQYVPSTAFTCNQGERDTILCTHPPQEDGNLVPHRP